MTTVRRVRVPARVVAHVLEHAVTWPELRLAGTLRKAPERVGGSRFVILDDEEAAALLHLTGYFESEGDGSTGDRLARVRAAQAIRKALR